MNSAQHEIKIFAESFKEYTMNKKISRFSESAPDLARNAIRSLFLCMTEHASHRCGDEIPLSELVTVDVHTEQIWQQTHLQILNILNLIKPNLKRIRSTSQVLRKIRVFKSEESLGKDALLANHYQKRNDMILERGDNNSEDEQSMRFVTNIIRDSNQLKLLEHRDHSEANSDKEDQRQIIRHKFSSFQIIQERISEEIEKLEANAVTKNTWSFLGEASGRQRPLNSALENNLEFHQVSKSRPNISIEATQSLEDSIKQRIILNKWDDVLYAEQSKMNFVNSPVEILNTQAKQGLGELYAKDFQNQNSRNQKSETVGETYSKEDEMMSSACALYLSLMNKLTSLTDFSNDSKWVDNSVLKRFEVAKTPEETYQNERRNEERQYREIASVLKQKLVNGSSEKDANFSNQKVSGNKSISVKKIESNFTKSSKVFKYLEVRKTGT